MNFSEWILLDTETTGFAPPVYVVEIAAQRMKGWNRVGQPFKRLLNHGTDIPPEAARVHGYTREILERDGDPPLSVYADFADYVEYRPLVAYNLPYDLDQVLLPEWARLGLAPIGHRGFCALALTQRLLDPVPAGNCKLQTLRQYYRLPERGAHTALGDVDTVIDLMTKALRPLAEARGLYSWNQIIAFCETEWFPTRIAFGKHKGRDFREARVDKELRSWLDWLVTSSNARSSAMGMWYLSELSRIASEGIASSGNSPFQIETSGNNYAPESQTAGQLVSYADPEVERLRLLITAARQRLADLSAEFMSEQRAVDAAGAALFSALKDEYRQYDMLKTLVIYRRRFIDTLLAQGDEEADGVKAEYSDAKAQFDREYEEAAQSAATTKDLSPEEEAEVKSIWKQLARLYHPDRVQSDPERKRIFENLLSVVNNARATGNIDLLREIGEGPETYMTKNGWDSRGSDEGETVVSLRAVYEAVSLAIIECIEEAERLRESEQYAVMSFCREHTDGLESIIAQRKDVLAAEIVRLHDEAIRLEAEIEELTGEKWGADVSRDFSE